ncbi:MAG: universal stress protein [Hymenobacteraceae bacterium]|nr:universal stress protein [Hymenobacteraceae bacterium]
MFTTPTPPLVVLTDFFAVTNRALSYAAGLAVPLQAQLVLLHVRHDALLAPYDHSSYYTRWGEQKTFQGLEKLAAAQPVPTEIDVSEEFMPDAVKEAIQHHHPLLLVLGRAGSSTAPEGIVANTAMNLLRNAPYPLLVIPAVGWDVYPPHRLLLAVDGEPFELGPHQDVVRRLLQATKASLKVVHVLNPDDQEQPAAAAVRSTEAVLNTIRANDLVDSLEAADLHQVHQPTVVGGVLREAQRKDADLLVVIARRHSFLGSLFHESVTAQLLRESRIPVLLLPAED